MSKVTDRASGKKLSVPSAGSGDWLGRELGTAVIAFHQAVASRLGLGITEWKCLGVLDQHGPLTAGRLADLSGFTTGAITGIVDRLERLGYVRREPNPSDRRSVIIHPVARHDLDREVAPIFASLNRAMGALTSQYTPQELVVIQGYFHKTIEVLRSEAAKLTKPKKPPMGG